MKTLKTTSIFNLFIFSCFVGISVQGYSQSTKTVLDNYFAAIGGKEKALQVESYSSLAKGVFNTKEITLETKSKLPSSFHSTMKSNTKIISEQIFNGKSGIKLHNGVFKKFSSKKNNLYKNRRSIFPEFNYYKNGKYLGIQIIDGQKAHIISVDNYEIYYSAKTGLKIKGIVLNPKNNQLNKELYYDKYIKIEGLLFPSKLTIVVKDKTIELQTVTITINRDVTNQDFIN